LPPRDDGADLVRLIRVVRGRVELRTEFILRFDYGFSVPWIERLEDAGLRAVAGPDMAVLRRRFLSRGVTSRPTASSQSALATRYLLF
jgi:hypothetical protein